MRSRLRPAHRAGLACLLLAGFGLSASPLAAGPDISPSASCTTPASSEKTLALPSQPMRDQRGNSETLWYTEPDEISLLGAGVEQFFATGEGTLQAPPGESIHRVGFMIDGKQPEALRVRALDRLGQWSEPMPVDVTWSEDDQHVARVDLAWPATAVVIERHHAQIDFARIEGITDVPVQRTLARDLPMEYDFGYSSYQPDGAGLANTPPTIISRAAWGARNTGFCGSFHSPRYYTVHHTATPNFDSISSPARMRQMQAYNIDVNGWCDIGYHYSIGIDGNIYQGRMTPDRTAAGVGGWNSNNVHTSLVGNFTSFTPRQRQLDALVDISRYLVNRYNIPLNRTHIRGHRDWPGHGSNSCPGARLHPWLNTLISLIQDGGTPPCEDECSAGARRCSNGGTQLCADYNGNGCATWGSTEACDGCGESCQAGSCVRDPEICCPEAVSGATGVFKDVVDDSWQADVAERMLELGITAGCQAEPRLFCPDCPISREQAALFLARGMELDTPAITASSFSDVDPSSPYAAAIEALYQQGIIAGCATNPLRFCPQDLMSRAQGGALLLSAANIEPVASATPVFADLGEDHWARPAVETLHRNCMIAGCGTDPLSYCPDASMTRVQFGRVLLDTQGLSLEESAPCCRPEPIAGGDEVFVDLTAGLITTRAARVLRETEVSAGCSVEPQMFCGDCQVDRGQAATLQFRAMQAASDDSLEVADPDTPPTFVDVPQDHPHFVAIESLAANGLVSGCATGPRAFCPDRSISRAEAAAMLATALELPTQTPSESGFDDVATSDWFAGAVSALNQGCILEACDSQGERFCPDDGLQRKDYALFLARAFRLGEFANDHCLMSTTDPMWADRFEFGR